MDHCILKRTKLGLHLHVYFLAIISEEFESCSDEYQKFQELDNLSRQGRFKNFLSYLYYALLTTDFCIVRHADSDVKESIVENHMQIKPLAEVRQAVSRQIIVAHTEIQI